MCYRCWCSDKGLGQKAHSHLWKETSAAISRLVQPFGKSHCQYLYRAGLGHSAVNEAACPQQNPPCVYEPQAHPYCHCSQREALIFQPSHTWVCFVVCVTSVSTAVSAMSLWVCSANHRAHQQWDPTLLMAKHARQCAGGGRPEVKRCCERVHVMC